MYPITAGPHMHLPSSARLPSLTPTPDELRQRERERQRVAHLVLGVPRPAPVLPKKPKGLSKQEWRVEKARLREAGAALERGVEEHVQIRERWSHHKHGTPETLEHAAIAIASGREGAIARLHRTGAIDVHQLAASDEICEAYRIIIADVAVRTAKLEPRGTGGGPDAAAAEHIRSIILQRAYTAWREACGAHAEMILAVIVDDMPLTKAARRWRMSNRRARTVLIGALDRWVRR